MKVTFCNEYTNNKELEFNRNSFSGKNLIYFDGKPMEKVGKNTYMINNQSDGNHRVYITGNEFKGLNIEFDNHIFNVIRNLNAFEYILVFLPLVIFFFNGALNGAIGGAIVGGCVAVAVMTICNLVRKISNIVVKIGMALLVTGAATGVWFVINELLF